jgi:hypothetical protein
LIPVQKTSTRLERCIGLKALSPDNLLVLAGWFYKCRLSTFTPVFTKKKEAKKKSNNSNSFIQTFKNKSKGPHNHSAPD